eukprot:7288469-Alexandrium_andersonii.AAC.1
MASRVNAGTFSDRRVQQHAWERRTAAWNVADRDGIAKHQSTRRCLPGAEGHPGNVYPERVK